MVLGPGSYFKTVASITAVGNPAGNVSAGINASAADVIFAGRSRFQGINLVCTATAGLLDFLTSSPTGTSIFKSIAAGPINSHIVKLRAYQ